MSSIFVVKLATNLNKPLIMVIHELIKKSRSRIDRHSSSETKNSCAYLERKKKQLNIFYSFAFCVVFICLVSWIIVSYCLLFVSFLFIKKLYISCYVFLPFSLPRHRQIALKASWNKQKLKKKQQTRNGDDEEEEKKRNITNNKMWIWIKKKRVREKITFINI